MSFQKVLTRLSCLLLATMAGAALAKECPVPPGHIEGKTFNWEPRRYLTYAAAGAVDQAGAKDPSSFFSQCTITPRTSNPRTLYNRNWYLYKCGEHSLVRVETYITCQESNNEIHESLRGNAYGQRLFQIVGDFACASVPFVARDSWMLRDKKGVDFPLRENEKLLGPWEKDQLLCYKNIKSEVADKVYEVSGITSTSARRYYVVIRRVKEFIPILVPERVPSM